MKKKKGKRTTPTLSYRQVGKDTSWFNLFEDGFITGQIQLCIDGWRAENQIKSIVNAFNGYEEIVNALIDLRDRLQMGDDHALDYRNEAEIAICDSLIAKAMESKKEGTEHGHSTGDDHSVAPR